MDSNEQATESIVECADCGRKYRAVTRGAQPSIDALTCHCGSGSFTEFRKTSPAQQAN